MSESKKRHEENSNLIKEIQASTDAAIRNQGVSIKTLEIQIGKEKEPGSFTLPCFINNVCFDNAIADLEASVSVMPLSTYLNLGLGELAHTKLTVELADRTVKYLKGIAKNVLIDVFKRKITLRVGEEKIIFKIVKPASSLIKRVYMLSLRERMELDLEARLMRETLVLNRSLDPFFEDYIELNDLNVPLELRRDQVEDLMPTIEEGEVIEEFRARNDARMVSKFFRYPSNCDHDKKISIDCTHNLKFSCMIGNFSIITDFAVLEDMDTYRDKGMGDIILGEPFLIEVGINARRFEGMITIHSGNEEIYSNPLFEFDDDFTSSDANPLFNEVLEDIECKVSYDSNLDESIFLVTPLSNSNEDECLAPGDDIELLLHHDLSISFVSILEGSIDEPPLKENDDLFDLEPKENDWKKILYDAPNIIIFTEGQEFFHPTRFMRKVFLRHL
ncbi:hypothetical protein Tco_1221131 [Tanacetum coccineum]